MTRRPPFQLIAHPAALSTDTVECLEQLLDEARCGKLIGLAFAAMYRNRKYLPEACGEAHRNPTFARGMVAALHDLLGRRQRGEE